jgi:DNA (cytosine-5)-methyltransferase 1
MRYNTIQKEINFPVQKLPLSDVLSCGEFFAGGGGWTHGIHKVPGMKTKWILNHDKVAISTNAFHHPEAKVYWADIYAQDEHDLEYVDCIHASVECQDHSTAKAGEEKRIGSYTMGWELYRYIKFLMPLVLTVENVPEFKKWAPLDENRKRIKSRQGEEFERWKQAFIDLGYKYKESIRNAADDGMPTRRKRYFGVFYHPDIQFEFPPFTHSKSGLDGKKKWVACKSFLNLEDEGVSIFGREFNEQLPKHLRKKLSINSLRRIGFGAVKYSPTFKNFVAQFYGGDPNRFQSIDEPIYTITTCNRHQLVTMEKMQFIADYCRSNNYQKPEEPLRTQLARQTKQLISLDHIICQYYGTMQAQDLNTPLNGINCKDRHQLIRLEKMQFIAKYMNSNGTPERNIESIDDPISPIMTEFKHQLITILDGFDIKARFLRPDELAGCSTFPRDYFNRPGLKVSGKNAVKMIGNAVPPDWAKIIMKPNLESIRNHKLKSKIENAA